MLFQSKEKRGEKDHKKQVIVTCLALLVTACFSSTCNSFPAHHTLEYDIPYVIGNDIKLITAFKITTLQMKASGLSPGGPCLITL